MYLKYFSTFNYYTKRRVLFYLQMIYHISTITQGTSLLPELPDSQSHSASIHPTPIYWSHLLREKRSAPVIPQLKTLQELPFIYGINSKILPTIWNYSTNTRPSQFVSPSKHHIIIFIPCFCACHLFTTNTLPNSDPWRPVLSPFRISIRPHLLLEMFPEVSLAYTPTQLTLSYSANSAKYESYLCMDFSLFQRFNRR